MTRGGEDGDVDDGVDDDERNAKEPGRREVRQEGEGTLLTPRRRESAITPAEDRGRDAIFIISPKSVRPAKKLPQAQVLATFKFQMSSLILVFSGSAKSWGSCGGEGIHRTKN